MIAIDTNVLLRYLLRDDDVQSPIARDLIRGDRAVLVTDVVLAETIWTLRGNRYKLGKSDLVPVLEALFAERNLRFEDAPTVWEALYAYRNAEAHVDFADALIVAKSRHVSRNRKLSFNGLFTFDKAAQTLTDARVPG